MLQVYKIMMGTDRVNKEDFLREMKEGEGSTLCNCLGKGFVWILPSTASVAECVTSGRNCQLQLHHPNA